MRMVASLQSEKQARSFCSHLDLLGIENQLSNDRDSTWEVWVISEDDVAHAEQLFKQFQHSPAGFGSTMEKAKTKGKVQKGNKTSVEKISKRLKATTGSTLGPEKVKNILRQLSITGHWRKLSNATDKHLPEGSLTIFLIVISFAMTVISQLGKKDSVLQVLLIADFHRDGLYTYYHKGLVKVMKGEVWRLITPIFVHFGVLHFLFNMWWLKDLGMMIERRKSAWFLGFFVLVVGIVSNILQFFSAGPVFGGMSGVIYGLLGYAWMKGKYEPSSGIILPHITFVIMMGWFFLCLTGLIGDIANAAHAAGLVLGAIYGFLTSQNKYSRF